jgi:hypothetical protein
MLLTYTLPAEPSSKRVLVWRHLRKMGALLDSGVWLLPRSPALEREFQAAVAEIAELGGRPLAFHARDFSDRQHEELKAAFNNVRSEEYRELMQRCDRFLGHVQRLLDEADFKFASVEEMEEDLEKRRRSVAQLIIRDVFEVPERAEVEERIRRCEAALTQFVEAAYAATARPADLP